MTASDKQLAILSLKVLKERLIILEGAIRSGKTLFAAWGFAEIMIDQQENRPVFEGNRYAIAAQSNVLGTFVNVVQRIVYWLTLRGYTCTKRGAYNYECVKKGVKFYIETFSINNTASHERLQGGTYRSIFLDEAALMSEENIDNIMGRCATFEDHKIIMTCNPEGPETHWFYQKFLKNNKQVFRFHFNMLDNPINSQETVDYFKSVMSEATYQKKIMGRWVANAGACFPQMPDVVDRLPEGIEEITTGLDYGQVDATTCVAVAIKNDHYYIFKEYYHKNGEDEGEDKTLIEYKTDIANFLNPFAKIYDCPINLYCETSPSPVLPMLERDDEIVPDIGIFPVNKGKEDPKSKSAIQERIEAINMLIKMGRLHFVGTDMPVYSAMQNAIYDKNGVRLDNGTSNIDSLDALEYALKKEVKHIMYNIFNNAPVVRDIKQEMEDELNGRFA